MKIRRVFIDAEELSSATMITFSGKSSRYLSRVLRLRRGDEIEAYLGDRRYRVRLVAVAGNCVEGSILEERGAEAAPDWSLTLAFGCVRPDPVEQILRHGTVLGVDHFVPLLTSRTTRRPADIKSRWLHILASAAAQSGRVRLPSVSPAALFSDFLMSDRHGATALLLSLSSGAEPLLGLLGRAGTAGVVILAGPEGGLDEAEEQQAVETGFIPASLGKATLRAETAVVVAAGIAMAWRHWKDSSSTAAPAATGEEGLPENTP